jgi:hypothetical protein
MEGSVIGLEKTGNEDGLTAKAQRRQGWKIRQELDQSIRLRNGIRAIAPGLAEEFLTFHTNGGRWSV